MEGSFHKRAEARQHHAEPRRTEPGCCCTAAAAAAGGGTAPLLLFTRVLLDVNDHSVTEVCSVRLLCDGM